MFVVLDTLEHPEILEESNLTPARILQYDMKSLFEIN